MCNSTINMCSRDHFQNATFDLGTSLNQTFRSMLHLSKISDLGISPPLAKAEASMRKEGTKCSQKPGQAQWLNTKEGQNKAAKKSDKGASMNFTSVKRTNISYRCSSLLNPQTAFFGSPACGPKPMANSSAGSPMLRRQRKCPPYRSVFAGLRWIAPRCQGKSRSNSLLTLDPSNKLATDSHQQRLSVNMMWPKEGQCRCKQLHLASWQIMAKVRAETTCAAIEQCMEWPLAKLINFSV